MGTATGRGEAIFFSAGEGEFVLRHYRRGGLPARFLNDRYLGFSLEGSRAWREWRLLDELYRGGLPVPQPIAARVVKQALFYRADLVTRRLDAHTLADILLREPVDLELWHRLGKTIATFHQHHVYHADLNARNIMLDGAGRFYLIDFDRGERRATTVGWGRGWQRSNLQRLRRSLDKFSSNNPNFNFSENNWQQVMKGYSSD